jgi:hypothetical protein
MVPAGGVLAVGLNASGASDPFALPAPGGQLNAVFLSSVVTAVSGTSPSLTVFLDVQGQDGTWRQVAALTAQTAVGGAATTVSAATITANLGATVVQGLNDDTGRLRWTVSGTAPVVTAMIAATAA